MLCLIASLLAGCGDKKKKEKESEKPAIVKGTIPEMMEAMRNTKAGKLHIEGNIAGNETISVALDIVYDRDSKKTSIGLDYATARAGVENKIISAELFRITGNKAYINLAALFPENGSLLSTKVEGAKLDGWYEIPLPEGIMDIIIPSENNSNFFGFFEKMIKGLQTQGEDGDYKVIVKTNEDYARMFTSLKEFSDAELKNIMTEMSDVPDKLGKIDWNKYMAGLFESYEDELTAIVEKYAADEVKPEQFAAMFEEVKKQDYDKIIGEKLSQAKLSPFSIFGFAGATEETADRTVTEVSKLLEEAAESFSKSTKDPSETTISVVADDTGYTVKTGVLLPADTAAKIGNINLQFRLEPGTFAVAAPSDTRSLTQIADAVFPAYKAYVEKSRMSTDVSMLDECIAAAEKIAVDPEIDAPVGAKFTVVIANGEIQFIVDANGNAATEEKARNEWKDIVYFTGAHSDVMKKANGRLTGTLDASGYLNWKVDLADENLRELIDFSSALKRRLNED